jgi:hypothetical protein
MIQTIGSQSRKPKSQSTKASQDRWNRMKKFPMAEWDLVHKSQSQNAISLKQCTPPTAWHFLGG